MKSQVCLVATSLACIKGDRLLFRELSFAVRSGEALQLMGPNGVGKTSLLRILAGLIGAEAGTVSIDGTSEENNPIDMLGVRDGLRAAMTVDEHLRFWRRLAGQPAQDETALLQRFGLARQYHLPVSVLSAGQRRRLAVLRLAINNRPVILMDEPLNALDTDGQSLLTEWLQERLEAGAIAIIATHQTLALPNSKTLSMIPLAVAT
jgi:heme exporter protein A